MNTGKCGFQKCRKKLENDRTILKVTAQVEIKEGNNVAISNIATCNQFEQFLTAQKND